MITRRALLGLALGLSAWLAGCGGQSAKLGTTQPATQPSLRVLFIGNSYTAFNGGLYRLLPEMAALRGRQVECAGSVSGGKSLEWHWNEGNARQHIEQGGWDWVVLQDYSLQALNKRETMFDYAGRFNQLIRQSGAKTALYLTWARAHQPENQQAITDAYTSLAKEFGATVVPCGIAWQRLGREHPEIKLYRADRSHPTAEGTYLNVCCFFATLMGGDPRGLPPATIKEEGQPPRTLDPEVSRVLQGVAWECAREASSARRATAPVRARE